MGCFLCLDAASTFCSCCALPSLERCSGEGPFFSILAKVAAAIPPAEITTPVIPARLSNRMALARDTICFLGEAFDGRFFLVVVVSAVAAFFTTFFLGEAFDGRFFLVVVVSAVAAFFTTFFLGEAFDGRFFTTFFLEVALSCQYCSLFAAICLSSLAASSRNRFILLYLSSALFRFAIHYSSVKGLTILL